MELNTFTVHYLREMLADMDGNLPVVLASAHDAAETTNFRATIKVVTLEDGQQAVALLAGMDENYQLHADSLDAVDPADRAQHDSTEGR